MINIIDESLSWLNKIDIYIYSPGSGGEFFSSLCALSHIPTRELLVSKILKGSKQTKENNIITIFKAPNYFNLKNFYIDEIGKHLFFWSGYMDPITKINYYKNILAHGILNNNDPQQNLSEKKEYYTNKNIILCTHWFNFNDSEIKNENFKNRTFGIPLLEKEKCFNIINLNPQTPQGKDLVINFCETLWKNIKRDNIKVWFEHHAVTNIKLKFPFMDYMVNSNHNLIKDYIENRYGSDLDFDFIDKALIDYKKIRIDPYL